MSSSSQAILLREYSQYGFASGVDSVITGCDGGFWYADAELMKMNCPMVAALPSLVSSGRPRPPLNQRRFRSMWAVVNAIQSSEFQIRPHARAAFPPAQPVNCSRSGSSENRS